MGGGSSIDFGIRIGIRVGIRVGIGIRMNETFGVRIRKVLLG